MTSIESGCIDVRPESNTRESGQMRPTQDLLLEVEQIQAAGLALATIRATVEPEFQPNFAKILKASVPPNPP